MDARLHTGSRHSRHRGAGQSAAGLRCKLASTASDVCPSNVNSCVLGDPLQDHRSFAAPTARLQSMEHIE